VLSARDWGTSSEVPGDGRGGGVMSISEALEGLSGQSIHPGGFGIRAAIW